MPASLPIHVFYRTGLTGGAAGDMDGIDGNSLAEGYRCQVEKAGLVYIYWLNASSGAAESSPGIISPDTNAGNKRWILAEIYVAKINGLTPTALATGFSWSGGTTSKTLTVDETLSLSDKYTKNVAMRNTAQPAFSAIPTSDQTNIAVGSNVTVVFGTELLDQGNCFASNTHTCTVAGWYQYVVKIAYQDIDSAATYYNILLITTGRTVSQTVDPSRFSGDLVYYGTTMVPPLLYMDVGDTAYVAVNQSGGTQQTDLSVGSWFSGYLVC